MESELRSITLKLIILRCVKLSSDIKVVNDSNNFENAVYSILSFVHTVPRELSA